MYQQLSYVLIDFYSFQFPSKKMLDSYLEIRIYELLVLLVGPEWVDEVTEILCSVSGPGPVGAGVREAQAVKAGNVLQASFHLQVLVE